MRNLHEELSMSSRFWIACGALLAAIGVTAGGGGDPCA